MARSYIDFQEPPTQGGATASKQAILHVTVREACVSRDRETQMKMPFAYRFLRFYAWTTRDQVKY